MVSFLCEYCNYKTDIKCNFVRHLKTFKHIKTAEIYGVTKNYKKQINFKTQKDPKKTQKDPKRPKKTQQITEKSPKNGYFTCIFCSCIYSTFAHQRRHEMHRCKHPDAIKHRKLLVSNRAIKELKKEHKKTVDMLISKIGTTNNTFINSNNNIQINSYGNEDMSHISDTLKTQMLNSPYSMIPKMIEHVHFNEQKPENKNIQLPNKKENKLRIFSNNKWIYKNKDEVLSDLIDGKYFIMDTHYENVCNKIKGEKYELFRNKFDDKNKKLIDIIKKESELVILNNR